MICFVNVHEWRVVCNSGGHLQKSAYTLSAVALNRAEVHKCVYTLRHVFVSTKFATQQLLSWSVTRRLKISSKRLLHLAELIQTSEELHECLKILFFE